MNAKVFFSLLAALVFGLGCASTRTPEVSPAPPEPLEGEALEEEMEVVTVEEVAEAEEPEAEAPRENLGWDELKALGRQYEVKPGDTLSGIARRLRVGTGLLVRLNDISDPDQIRIGQKLTVIEGPFRIEVDKSDRILTIYQGDNFIRSYPVAIGTKNSTPEGEYTVLRKLVEPPWTDPYNRVIVRAGEPDYPLGSRWIEFKPPPGAYGIHGTDNIEDLGKEVSFGCVRVLHPEEEEIYDFVTLGSPVVITP